MQPPPTSTPNPTAPRRRPPNPRPLVGAVLAAVGTVALLVGIVAVASPRGLSATPPGPSGSATAGGGPSPSAPASPSGSPAAVTPLPSTADPVLAGAGDIGRCGSAEPALTAGILAGTPGQLFTLGDNAYDHGTAADFANCFDPTWGRVRNRIAFPVPGNHDWETDKAAGYLGYFGTAAAPQGTTWYSRDLGAWHVIVLDATCAKVGGCGEGSPQLAWLRDDLAHDAARCTLALWHQPRFSSGEHGDDSAIRPFWEALYAAGADLVLNGHDHDYERFAPQDPAGRADPARGLTEIVVGTGGTSLREFATLAANSVVRNSFAHGVLVLTLHATSWDYRFVSTDGSFSDQGHGACH